MIALVLLAQLSAIRVTALTATDLSPAERQRFEAALGRQLPGLAYCVSLDKAKTTAATFTLKVSAAEHPQGPWFADSSEPGPFFPGCVEHALETNASFAEVVKGRGAQTSGKPYTVELTLDGSLDAQQINARKTAVQKLGLKLCGEAAGALRAAKFEPKEGELMPETIAAVPQQVYRTALEALGASHLGGECDVRQLMGLSLQELNGSWLASRHVTPAAMQSAVLGEAILELGSATWPDVKDDPLEKPRTECAPLARLVKALVAQSKK